MTELLASLEPDLPGENRAEGEWIAEIERRARAALARDLGSSWSELRVRVEGRFDRR